MTLPMRLPQDMADPTLRLKLTQLQWLDSLTGQVDRTAQNYFIQRAPDGSALNVSGIDNDAAFGVRLISANEMSKGRRNSRARMPDLIDRPGYDALMALTPDDLARCLGGLLTQAEIDATQARLRDIQAHLGSFEQQGHVLESPADWASDQASELLGLTAGQAGLATVQDQAPGKQALEITRQLSRLQHQAKQTSYVAREAMEQACDQWMRRRFGLARSVPDGVQPLLDMPWLQAQFEAAST